MPPVSREDLRNQATSHLIEAARDPRALLRCVSVLQKLVSMCRSARGKYANYPRVRQSLLDAAEEFADIQLQVQQLDAERQGANTGANISPQELTPLIQRLRMTALVPASREVANE